MTKELPETLPDLVAGLASQLALPDFPKTEGADGVKVKRDEHREKAAKALEVQGERRGGRGS